MILRGFVAGLTVFCAAALLSAPADAQARDKRTVARNVDRTVVIHRDEDGRRRTKIIVQRRSFLDTGREAMPGDHKYTDYAIPPNYSATSVIDNTAFSADRQSRPGPFDLPSKNNPRQW